jgi:hypothetical protein
MIYMTNPVKEPPAPIEYPAVEIKFKDLFDFKELYMIMFAWLKEQGWKDRTTGEDVEYMEEFYLEKTSAAGAKDHIIYWDVDKFASDYFKYSMNIKITTTYLNLTELMQNDKKITVNNGEVGIKIVAKLHPDYQGKWINHWALGPFHDYMSTTVLKKESDLHKVKIYKQLYGFQAEIKRYLKLKQFMSGKDEGFIPEKRV